MTTTDTPTLVIGQHVRVTGDASSAKGVTGNQLPNNNEMGGRAGEGRTGKSQGEMVEDTASASPFEQAAAAVLPVEVAKLLAGLDTREREVLRHIARGYLYKEIALRLGISQKTVEAHVSAVLRKLQLSNRHELSRWAVERRLVE